MSKLPYTRVHVELSGAPGGWEGEFTVMPLVSTFLEGIAGPDQPYFCFFSRNSQYLFLDGLCYCSWGKRRRSLLPGRDVYVYACTKICVCYQFTDMMEILDSRSRVA